MVLPAFLFKFSTFTYSSQVGLGDSGLFPLPLGDGSLISLAGLGLGSFFIYLFGEGRLICLFEVSSGGSLNSLTCLGAKHSSFKSRFCPANVKCL